MVREAGMEGARSIMAALTCTKEEEQKIHHYAQSLMQLITEYRWLTDSYIVEFFFKDHWSKIPKSWQETLCDVELKQAAHYFSRDGDFRHNSVWPLSLLAFCAATQSLALKRHPRKAQPHPGEETPTQLDHCFKYHVKNKKRHEIQTLAELINRACKASHCNRVVDVGGGQGHLTRLLAVGYGLSVMSIEAAGCHVDGAAKVDKKVEVLRQRRERTGRSERPSSAPPQSPVHVVCTINPDISVVDFVKIVSHHLQLKKTAQETLDNAKVGMEVDSTDNSCSSSSLAPHLSHKSSNEKRSFKAFSENTTDEVTTDKVTGDASLVSIGNAEEVKNTKGDECGIQKLGSSTHSDSYKEEHQTELLQKIEAGPELVDRVCLPSKKVKTQNNCDEAQSDVSLASGHLSSDISQEKRHFEQSSHNVGGMLGVSSKLEQSSNSDSTELENNLGSNQFTLVGLHTCGDLGPTILRVFIKCPDVQVLASVGCCYMKMQCVQPIKELDRNSADMEKPAVNGPHNGFPMSRWVQNLSGNDLTFEPLELACHFFDSYYERLKAEDPNLILQGYRAMLEILIQRTSPDLVKKHAGIRQIKKATGSIKKAHSMTFESYAEAAFKKLGLTFDHEAARLLEKEYRPRWRHVIIYHSLRLCLAPIVESLVLVDRMLYLLENGGVGWGSVLKANLQLYLIPTFPQEIFYSKQGRDDILETSCLQKKTFVKCG
ncbi:Protein RRNAD1 [Holothuria leucospilota]|uniref:Protein RRNAD1 n=1 Tax=Holothuria leucospilota TaxID=206669 RepID=A0A9Q1H213_HOLLE|nr:Protein RRNAD1 [Holothuria leucospilota]